MVELTLFEKYSIDTNVIVSFLGDGDAGLYPVDVFGLQWDFLEAAFKDGRVVAAKRVATELKKWERLDRMKIWLRDHKHVFRDIESDEQLIAARATPYTTLLDSTQPRESREQLLGPLSVSASDDGGSRSARQRMTPPTRPQRYSPADE